MKNAISKFIFLIVLVIAGYSFWTTYGPAKYQEAHTLEESYEIACQAILKQKSRVSIVSDVAPISEWQSLTEAAIQRDAFKGSNLQAYKYTYTEKDGKYYTNYKFTYGSGRLALLIADQKMDDMAEELEGFSDYEKIKAVHDYLVLQCEYTGGYASIYDALFNGKTICVGYAGTFFRVMNKMDIPVQYVCGNNHAWNLVQLDGKWYNMDVTWDDAGGNQVSYEHFLKTDSEFVHESKGATASKSINPTGKSAEENFELFSNREAIYYYGPWIILGIIVIFALFIIWSKCVTKKRY